MNPFAIAVQGIGFAVALVAVQGLGIDDSNVIVRPEVPIAQSAPLGSWDKGRANILVAKKVANATIPAIASNSTVADIAARGSAKATATLESSVSSVAPIKASGQLPIKFSLAPTKAKLGQILAQGQHDMEDEDILALLLSMLEP